MSNKTQDAITAILLFQYLLSVEYMACLNRFSFWNTCNISHIALLHDDNKDTSQNTCEYMLNKCKDNYHLQTGNTARINAPFYMANRVVLMGQSENFFRIHMKDAFALFPIKCIVVIQ